MLCNSLQSGKDGANNGDKKMTKKINQLMLGELQD